MNSQTTLVIGASTNPERYSNMAIKKLLEHKYNVAAIGAKKGTVNKVQIETIAKPYTNIHTVTLYINPQLQKEYYDYIIALNPQRIIFNPGTENIELAKLAQKNFIQSINACTLVLLSTNQY